MSNIELRTSHTEAARRLLENLRAMQDAIEGFVLPPTPMDFRSRPRGHSLLPTPFFLALAVALESSPQLSAALQGAGVSLTPAEVRDMLRHGEAYLPVAEALERFARGLRYSVALRRGKVGRVASAAYAIAKGLNLLVDAAVAVPETDAMKRAFGNRRRRNAPEEAEPAMKKKTASG
jgi:hypothetical protein